MIWAAVLRLELLAVRVEIALRLRARSGRLAARGAFHLGLDRGHARAAGRGGTAQRRGDRRVLAFLVLLALGGEQRGRPFGGSGELRLKTRLLGFELRTVGQSVRHEPAQTERLNVGVVLRELSEQRMLLDEIVHPHVSDAAAGRRRCRCGRRRTAASTSGEHRARNERQQWSLHVTSTRWSRRR